MEDRMPAHAQPGTIGYDIAEHDADGVGVHLITVYALSDRPDIEKQAARLLVIARNLEGGWDRAIEVLRAERVRQEGGG